MDLNDRIDRLEAEYRNARNESRRWRWLSLFLAIAFLAASFGLPEGEAQPKKKTVTANRFALQSEDGKIQGLWSFDKKGRPGLKFLDDNGKVRSLFSLGSVGQPLFALLDSNGKIRVTLSLDKSDAPALALKDENGKLRASMALTRSGKPIVFCKNAEGKTIHKAPK